MADNKLDYSKSLFDNKTKHFATSGNSPNLTFCERAISLYNNLFIYCNSFNIAEDVIMCFII